MHRPATAHARPHRPQCLHITTDGFPTHQEMTIAAHRPSAPVPLSLRLTSNWVICHPTGSRPSTQERCVRIRPFDTAQSRHLHPPITRSTCPSKTPISTGNAHRIHVALTMVSQSHTCKNRAQLSQQNSWESKEEKEQNCIRDSCYFYSGLLRTSPTSPPPMGRLLWRRRTTTVSG